jgi:hypothetical protein
VDILAIQRTFKMEVEKMKNLVVLVLVLALTGTVWAFNQAEDRTWEEDMTVAPWIANPGDWTQPSRTMNPSVSGGFMTWTTDTEAGSWALIDDAPYVGTGGTAHNHNYLANQVDVDIDWGAAPANAGVGVGVWLNVFANENDTTSDWAAPWNAMLGRDIDGAPVVFFEQSSYNSNNAGLAYVNVAEGPVTMHATLLDTGNAGMTPEGYVITGTATYTITDSASNVYTGSVELYRYVPQTSQIAAVTLVAYGGYGSIDYVKVASTPEPITMALLGLGGLFLRRRK